MSDSQWLRSREVVERVIITGRLVLETPTSFGNGDTDGLTDIALSRDPLDGAPLLTGASIAGALRNYLREYERGFGWAEQKEAPVKSYAELLFGHLTVDDDPVVENRRIKATVQSWLMIDDALGTHAGVELRDGVAIEAKTRTAEEHKKYDLELLAAGTTFDICFEL